MSSTIKVNADVYHQLDELRGKGETFSQVIAQLLETRVQVFSVIGVLENTVQYDEWKQGKLRELLAAGREG